MRGVVSDYLRAAGYSITEASDGISALELADGCDLVILDLMLPGIRAMGEALEEGIAPDPASYHRAIVAAHRGTVDLRNRPPGCEITIELPRAASGAEIRG